MTRRTARTGRGRGNSSGKKSAAEIRKAESLRVYRDKRRVVQPLVSFDIPKDPTPATRKKLNRYFDYLKGTKGEAGITSGVRVKVRRKDPKVLAKLQRELGQGALPGIKYAFVPSMIDPKTRLVVKVQVRTNKIKADVIRIRPISPRTGKPSGVIQFRFEALNHKALLKDPVKEIERAILALKEQVDPDEPQMFRVRSNDRTVTDVDTDDSITSRVQRYMVQYRLTWREWLDGITMETAGQQTTLSAYHRARLEDKERKKEARKINIPWVSMLTAIEQGPPTNTETLALRALGSPSDPSGLAMLKRLKTAGLVNGDDNRWWNTHGGTAYLKRARSVLPNFMV